jgi:S1-C subfamily serine protease
VQIQGSDLPVARLGDSRRLQVGDWVVAIGNALALQGGPTVTQGVVSALGRTVQEPGDRGGGAGPFLFDVIQTDAPINPGNSGGPLVNLHGEVVGINTLVAGQAEPGVPAQGIGFAIAIATAKPIADELAATGHVEHPFLGIRYISLNPAIAAQLGVPTKDGVLIVEVAANSPAAKAGLQPDDVITAVEGKAVQDASALAYVVTTHRPGERLTLTVVRGNQQRRVPLTLGVQPSP